MPLTIQEDISLKLYNTFGIEAKARYFCSVSSIDSLQLLLADPTFQSLPKFILGGGSNILLSQDFAGLVVKIDIPGINVIDENDHNVWLQVGAGVVWHELVLFCIKHNYSGIENLSLIPGTVGAAPIQNIGAYGVELREVFDHLEALRCSDLKLTNFLNSDCQFGYRNSIFKHSHKDQFIICTVTLRLNKYPQFNVSYGDIEKTLQNMQVKELSLKAVSDAVITIRQSKLPDPKMLGNAGSFFKNPIISLQEFSTLKNKFSEIPSFGNDATTIKIPAAWLIEQCGFKGKRYNNIGVHEKQALVLVNYGDGKGLEIKQLADTIRTAVADRFGISLETEVNIL